MRRAIGPTILAAVAAASAPACALSPLHQECTTTETVRSDVKEIETRRACDDLAKRSGDSSVDCKSLCGDGYNRCFHQSAYPSIWNEANQSRSAPDAPFTCPAPSDGRAVVRIECHETRPKTEYTMGGCAVEGRRPERLLPPARVEDTSALAGYFAHVAHLEAAAVLAFEHMVVELRAYGAPADLVAAAEQARRDEVRHARATTRLARRFGATPPPATVSPTPVRDLLSIALENEIEGVVRETLGAAIATWRAEHAADADVRAAMRLIAADERAHADLSWRLSTWLFAQLGPEERTAVAEARRTASAELRATFATDLPTEVVTVAGAPRARDVHAMITRLEQDLWTAARAA